MVYFVAVLNLTLGFIMSRYGFDLLSYIAMASGLSLAFTLNTVLNFFSTQESIDKVVDKIFKKRSEIEQDMITVTDEEKQAKMDEIRADTMRVIGIMRTHWLIFSILLFMVLTCYYGVLLYIGYLLGTL